jgi:hypothetical protein
MCRTECKLLFYTFRGLYFNCRKIMKLEEMENLKAYESMVWQRH